MFTVGKISVSKALLLAPMEDVTDLSFRRLCRKFGADIVYTEFINSDGLIRGAEKLKKKLLISDDERPVSVQIYGQDIEPMIESARIAEEVQPDFIDINAGCWVKKVAGRGAGAGLLKDPDHFEKMVKAVCGSVKLPVTVKTRLGWDDNSINIEEIAKRIEGAGAAALTLHCRTRAMGHSGEPRWEWIEKVKKCISIPLALNGGVMTAADAKKAFELTPCDAVMIARGAIGEPWIFQQARELIDFGEVKTVLTLADKIHACLDHFRDYLQLKGERPSVTSFRKFYSGYLKGFPGVSDIRRKLMMMDDSSAVIDYLYLLEQKAKAGAFDRPVI